MSLGRLRRYQDVQALAQASDAYHRHWYLPAIRELSLTDVFRADPKWIARVLTPKILTREAKLALTTLEQLGLLRPDGRMAVISFESLTDRASQRRGRQTGRQ